jgi:hypothetical protein
MKFKILILIAVLTAGCASAPVYLTPAGIAAFNKTRVIKGLDVIRDTAVDANKTIPPIISTATTRKIVEFHRSTLVVINVNGVRDITTASLDELIKNLPQSEKDLLTPYVILAKTILNEVNK